ncbi:DUF3618 domain-containing protein [Kibdelosporangium philippinense]|uniref:DUF3618 domain-containing protein n=1 Tax=Kibdelosporangium philippinense TaxID=211113 RepID=A0ABS8ZT57_9PSEU|nr:DUF3618 domain-containing protein [Kibdelosporangium philippinense]MCE7010909.1 DUF3618 domain-containing protein [Kibdelosporangium philippinense]
MNDFPKTAEQARIDRDATREEITETLNALAYKLNVKGRASEAVGDSIDRASTKIAGKVSPSAAERFRHSAYAVRNHPLRVIAVLVALVVAIRLSLRLRS